MILPMRTVSAKELMTNKSTSELYKSKNSSKNPQYILSAFDIGRRISDL